MNLLSSRVLHRSINEIFFIDEFHECQGPKGGLGASSYVPNNGQLATYIDYSVVYQTVKSVLIGLTNNVLVT